MNRDLEKLRRRPFFFPLLFPVLVFIAVVAAAAWLFDARATTVVVVVRHAETEVGTDPDPGLSVDGRERAARLAMEPRPAGEHTLWSLQRELRREGPREAVRVTLNFLAN